MNIYSLFFSGAVMMGFWVAGLFFFRFWMKTRDRFFAIFGLAFWMMAVEQIVIVVLNKGDEDGNRPIGYICRLLAFLIIIGGIIDKNRSSSLPEREQAKSR